MYSTYTYNVRGGIPRTYSYSSALFYFVFFFRSKMIGRANRRKNNLVPGDDFEHSSHVLLGTSTSPSHSRLAIYPNNGLVLGASIFYIISTCLSVNFSIVIRACMLISINSSIHSWLVLVVACRYRLYIYK